MWQTIPGAHASGGEARLASHNPMRPAGSSASDPRRIASVGVRGEAMAFSAVGNCRDRCTWRRASDAVAMAGCALKRDRLEVRKRTRLCENSTR